jgi:hypothetical protein
MHPHYVPRIYSASDQEYFWGKERPELKVDNLTDICQPIVYKMWEPRRFRILWAFTGY